MGSHFNALAFTSDGNQAVAYLDYESATDLDFGGLLNATEVVFMDLADSCAEDMAINAWGGRHS